MDSYELHVTAALLGHGIPLFRRSDDVTALRLTDHPVFLDGVVRAVYEPA
jgi:hypothetical protein